MNDNDQFEDVSNNEVYQKSLKVTDIIASSKCFIINKDKLIIYIIGVVLMPVSLNNMSTNFSCCFFNFRCRLPRMEK